MLIVAGALGIDEKSSQAEAEARAVDGERKFSEQRRKKEAKREKERQQLHEEREIERQHIREKYKLSHDNKKDQRANQEHSTGNTDSKKCNIQ